MAKFKLVISPFDPAYEGANHANISPVYFLMGEDQFLQQRFVEKVQKSLSADQPVEKMVLIPEDMGSNEVIEELTGRDLFNLRKLFILRNPNGLKGKSRKELIEFCKNPIVGNTLILVHDEYGVKNKLMESLATIVQPISCSTPFENEMVKWINIFFQENGIKKVSKTTVNKLIQIAGDSLYHLKNEIDKVAISVENGKEITEQDIEKFSGWKRKYKQYEFFNFLGRRQLKESLELGRSMVLQDTTMINLLYPLTEFFQELLFIKISPGTNPPFKGYTRLSPSVNRQLGSYAKQYSSKEIIFALKRLGEIDTQLKASRIQDESAITEFVYATVANG